LRSDGLSVLSVLTIPVVSRGSSSTDTTAGGGISASGTGMGRCAASIGGSTETVKAVVACRPSESVAVMMTSTDPAGASTAMVKRLFSNVSH